MATLGAALARGFAGYAAGRQEREQEDYRRAQIEQQRLRQEKLDEQNRQRQELLMQQVTQSMQMQQAQDADRVGRAQRDLSESGYRPTGDQAEEYLKAIGLDPASMPTTTLGGQQYRKSGQSTQYMAGLQQQREQETATAQKQAQEQAAKTALIGQLPASMRAGAAELPLADLQRVQATFISDRLKPKAPAAAPTWETKETANGLVQINPRTGEARPVMIGGQPVMGKDNGMPRKTEGQRRVSGLVEIADAERQKLEALGTPSPYDRFMAKVPFGLGEPLMSDKGQQYLSAAEAFARPYLYAVSGAAASDKEAAANARQAIPGPFTRAATVKDMEARRGRLVDGMRTIANEPAADAPRDESPAAAAFRKNAKAEGYTDDEIDAELKRRRIP
jgi:hypothetical protein